MKPLDTAVKKTFSSYKEDFCLLKTIDFEKLLKSIPQKTVDLILTDPPYAISKKTGFKSLGQNSVKRFAVSMDFGKWDQKEIDLNKFAKESYRVLKQGGTAIVFYDIFKITKLVDALSFAGFKMLRVIMWEKTNPVPLNSKCFYLSNAREIAVCGVKGGKPKFMSEYDSGIYLMPIHREKRIHPTQKPLKLMEALIEKHSEAKDLVVDPFVGSGATALASYQLKRKFIGGDKDSNYIIKAKKRLKEAYQKRAIFRTRKTGQNGSIKKGLSKRV